MRIFIAACICVGILFSTAPAAEIGSKIYNCQLEDASGKIQSLQAFSGKVIVIVFWSFKCPVSLAYDERAEALQKKYGAQGAVVLAVASNENETAGEIRANAANLNLKLPVFRDLDGDLALKLGATHTPSVFIFDGSGILRYMGALDNNKKIAESGRIAYAEDALDAIFAGRIVAAPETKPFGCSIRRKTP